MYRRRDRDVRHRHRQFFRRNKSLSIIVLPTKKKSNYIDMLDVVLNVVQLELLAVVLVMLRCCD